MLKFRVDNSEARRAAIDKSAAQKSVKPEVYEEAIPFESTEGPKVIVNPDRSGIPESIGSTNAANPPIKDCRSSVSASSSLVLESNNPSKPESISPTEINNSSRTESTSLIDATNSSEPESTSPAAGNNQSGPECTSRTVATNLSELESTSPTVTKNSSGPDSTIPTAGNNQSGPECTNRTVATNLSELESTSPTVTKNSSEPEPTRPTTGNKPSGPECTRPAVANNLSGPESASPTVAIDPSRPESTRPTVPNNHSGIKMTNSTDNNSPPVSKSPSFTNVITPPNPALSSSPDATDPTKPECLTLTGTDSSKLVELTGSTRFANSKVFTFPSGEAELHEAIHGWVNSGSNNIVNRRQWSIPESDSGDEFIKKENAWPSDDDGKRVTTTGRPVITNFNLPSDSEEEDPYSLVKSPSMSVKSVEPPLPPPVSTIPRNKCIKQAPGDTKVEQKLPHDSPAVEIRAKVKVNAMVDLKKRSVISDTDPYDEIDNYSDAKQQTKEGQSEPRFHFTLSKSRSRLNPLSKAADDTYAEIPKKVPWNFPSSSDEEDLNEQRTSRKKVPGSRVRSDRRGSVTSDEEDKPSLPPKIWEESAGATYASTNGADLNVSNSDHSRKEDGITIEYSALQRTNVLEDGALSYSKESPTFTHSSGFEENDNGDDLSDNSEDSSKVVTDYEESCACIDMDQISLDSSGRRPKRIVETHETHEIVPADNNEDDIVERIIETQTITEKLDDKHNLVDYGSEDYSKYLDNDDEFVSHIFTLGRTLEKGSRKKRSKDFAFVENPFSVPDPVIETMPLERKTVKQKITTLVKKKKAKDDDNLYDEIHIAEDVNSAETGSENDDYDHMNDLLGREGKRWSEATDQYEYNDTVPTDVMRWDTGPKERPKTGGHSSAAGASGKGLSYEPINPNNDFSQHEITDTQKETKSEKRSIFKGIKKLLKKKDKNQDVCKVEPSVLDDDYQEFVP